MPHPAQLKNLPSIEQPLSQSHTPATSVQLMPPAEVNKALGNGINPPTNTLPSERADKTVAIHGAHGAYVGEAFPPVAAKVAAKML